MANELEQLRDQLRIFAAERDWDQFHSPKNLACSLSIEAAEVLELFQWLTDEQSESLSLEKREALADELSDVLLYLIRLADKVDIDPVAAAQRKLKKNSEKYPISLAKGTAKKYTEL